MPATTVTVDFDYDNRHQLISEVRTPDQQMSVYAFTHEYDQLGNRLRKYDGVSGGVDVVHMSYLGTTAQLDRNSGAIQYSHGDLIESTFLTTDANGGPARLGRYRVPALMPKVILASSIS